MRAVTILSMLAALGLAGCSNEPSFDERYATESNRIEGMAANMQAQLDEQLNASAAAGRLALPIDENDVAYNATAQP
ncbi:MULTISPECIES: hypothetical protein [unclassified Sphingobium]|uniref:hypothetical protein n=1 Tax=unclassified Sphingobium TaxID=2611147 RepID=UPI0022258A08|nr:MULTISPECIES: hypothetical protein [unclassified Sphingobium]MCW2381378.1 hypothetical protein [Sphingobium sp. B2D3B]MCW2398515.1 hypothetical protein [Sphingobium sp. B2D3C]